MFLDKVNTSLKYYFLKLMYIFAKIRAINIISHILSGQLRDLVDVATNQDLQQQIAAMIDIRELNLGKNYFTYNAKDAIKQLQQLMAKTGEIKDLCMLPAKISIENDVATACLETNILMKVSSLYKFT